MTPPTLSTSSTSHRPEPQPPADPRADWNLPRFGTMPRVAELDEVTVRVLADNSSPMTLDGTNTHVISPQGAGVALVVDPGPDDPDHLARVEAVLAQRDAAVVGVVATHHHVDHAQAAAGWAARWRCRVHANDPAVAGPGGVVIGDGDRIDLPGLRVDVIATPGHTADHVALRLGTGGMLTGDHVLGRGTSVVARPDGNLAAYLASLRRIVTMTATALFPGHGPTMRDDPTAVIRYYLAHREFRLGQVMTALGDGPRTARGLVEVIYAEVDQLLWPAAESSTRAALEHLAAAGRIVMDDGWARRVI